MNSFKALIATLILLAYWMPAQAQDIVYSPDEKFDFRNGSYGVVGKVDDLVYVYRGSNEGYFLDAYDERMEKKATVVLDFIYGKVVDTRFVTYGDRIIFLYQTIEDAKVTQYAVLLDERGRIKRRPIMLGDTRLGLFGSTKSNFGVAVSKDKSRIVVYELEDHGKTLDAAFTWLSDSLTVISRNRASYSGDNDISEGDAIVGNDGKVYLPMYTPIGTRNYADRLWLLTIKPGERKFVANEVPLNNMYAAGTEMELDNALNVIAVAGFYSDKKNGNYEGVMYTRLNLLTESFEPVKFVPFDTELRNATGERNKKRAFNDYQVKKLIMKDDGGFVLIAEDYFVSTRNNYAQGFGYYSFYYPAMSSTVREYHYNDIMALSYDSEGKGQWRSFIRKEQYSLEDGGMFSSYAFVNTGGSLGFMYNDFNQAHSRVQLATIASNGEVEVHTMQASGDDADWLPRNARQVAAREIIVPCLRKRQICFAKVVF